MSDIKLEKLIEEEAARDAIHIAIAPVIAGQALKPGQHVGLNDVGEAVSSGNLIGIVDPFLTKKVLSGQKFYLCLYQNTVTGMKHHWSHPAFSERQKEFFSEHQTWIEHCAGGYGLTYEEIMAAADNFVSCGDYLCEGGRFEGDYIPDEFWDHYEKIRGKRGEGSFFSCSC